MVLAAPVQPPVPKNETAPATVNNVLIQPTQNHIQNDNKQMAITGNNAERDQTNTAVTQGNNANEQTVIGSQTHSQDLNVVNSNTTVHNNSNTTITNTDQSVHNTSHLTVSHDNSDRSQQTVNNHFQEVQNVYKIEQKAATERVVQYVSAPTSQQRTGQPLTMEMVRQLILNAKQTSDMAYDIALQFTQ
jgi:hypothetical protein